MTTHVKRSTPLFERSHLQITRIQRLTLREERERTGLFYIEGMRFVAQALHHQATIEHLVVCRELLTHPFAQRLVREQKKRGTPVLEVSHAVMESLSQVQDSQGLGAVVRQRWQRLESVRARDKLCWIAVEALRSPGNLGTILRTSDAVGGAGLMLFGRTTDSLNVAMATGVMLYELFSQRRKHTEHPAL